MHAAGPGEGTSRDALQTSTKILGSTTIGVDPTLSVESCAAPPEAVSTASPSSPQFLEQEERQSNRRARETCFHSDLASCCLGSPINGILSCGFGADQVSCVRIPHDPSHHKSLRDCLGTVQVRCANLPNRSWPNRHWAVFLTVGQLWATDFGQTKFGQN